VKDLEVRDPKSEGHRSLKRVRIPAGALRCDRRTVWISVQEQWIEPQHAEMAVSGEGIGDAYFLMRMAFTF
jgi:hypothetical protein